MTVGLVTAILGICYHWELVIYYLDLSPEYSYYFRIDVGYHRSSSSRVTWMVLLLRLQFWWVILKPLQ